MKRGLKQALVAAAVGVAAIASASRADTDFNRIQRGKYLVDAGDCKDCHTADSGKPFAGGRPLQTPFGVIYSANITPDRTTGIGAWSGEQFYRALHEGVDAGGHQLYPAFPYPYYTHVTRRDVADIQAYLQSIAPVSNRPPPNQLPFPLNQRTVMHVWNWMYFKDGTFKPDPKKSQQWNRGAYLVEGLGHCGACHTPKNFAGADETSSAFQGGNLQSWFAPNLEPDLRAGLGHWSAEDIVEYLKNGRNRFSNATGPMSEVVQYSTSKLSGDDLHAIATYLKDLPKKSQDNDNAKPSADAKVANAGKAIFGDQCAECHGADGAGEPTFFPPLKGNNNVQQTDPTTVLRVILEGARSVPTKARPTPLSMPAFDWKLSDAQIAAVATYIRSAWGNAASPVDAGKVAPLRKAVSTSSD
jgi:mono/diheme cytochrome c family protein